LWPHARRFLSFFSSFFTQPPVILPNIHAVLYCDYVSAECCTHLYPNRRGTVEPACHRILTVRSFVCSLVNGLPAGLPNRLPHYLPDGSLVCPAVGCPAAGCPAGSVPLAGGLHHCVRGSASGYRRQKRFVTAFYRYLYAMFCHIMFAVEMIFEGATV
jgi:hypothetical protein